MEGEESSAGRRHTILMRDFSSLAYLRFSWKNVRFEGLLLQAGKLHYKITFGGFALPGCKQEADGRNIMSG